MKNLIKKALENEPDLSLMLAVRRAGGIENLTDDQAEKLVRRFKLGVAHSVDADEEAYMEVKRLTASIKYWTERRAEVGEAHGFGEMCAYDPSGDAELLQKCDREIAACEMRIAELREAATRHAKFVFG